MLGNVATVKQKEAVAALMSAMKSGKQEEVQTAWNQFHESVVESVRQDFEMANGDMKILAQRGFRQLTQEEKKYYEKVIEAGKKADPKQALTDLLTIDGGMPNTILEDVYKDLVEQHPLLAKINFQNVKYLTRWIMNDHSVQTAQWGEINEAITKEITSGFKTVEITQCKLSAYAMIEKDMLELGPVFLDNYIRTFLRESIYVALEQGIVSGSGLKMPIGLNRDIHEGVTFNSTTGYPEKTAIKVTSFLPAEYGPLVAKLAVSEKGRMRKFDSVTLACNQVDFLTKIMPATTVLTAAGIYARDLFPFPTEVVRTNYLDTGKAILFLPEEYFMGIGTSKDGTLEYSDEYKFLEDKRVFKIKMHAMGKAFDNTVAIVLDISELDPAYITVLQKQPIVVNTGGDSNELTA